jgi:hypothetical protein
VRFESPDASGRFRLTLKLESEERFQLTATDPLGRSLWALDLEDDSALLIEHRFRRFCRFGQDFEISSLFLGSFPVASLPALLLGRVPVAPEGAPVWSPVWSSAPQDSTGPRDGKKTRQLHFLDSQGRRWSAHLAQGMEDWEMRSPAGELQARMGRDEEGWWLRDEALQLELSWREVVGEALKGDLSPLSVPRGYREGGCLQGGAEP